VSGLPEPFDKLMAGGVEGPFDSVHPEFVEGLRVNGVARTVNNPGYQETPFHGSWSRPQAGMGNYSGLSE
jgi:hypothetical protein